jgi:hypothetical protein
MPQEQNHTSLPSEGFGKVPNNSESFGNVPKDAEPFRTVPHDAESFRSVPKVSERGENHTLTVREAARMFEAAGVARTERSIVNWCQPNKTGIARLDCYFDPNERRYYITPQSVESAVAEEKAKAAKGESSEAFGKVRNDAENLKQSFPNGSESREIQTFKNEIRDLQITNKVKDGVIEQMQDERKYFVEQIISANRRVGELENKLLQLENRENLN